MAHNGLALAVSLSSFFNLLFQMIAFRRKVGRLGLRKVMTGASRTVFSTIIMMGILWWLSEAGPLTDAGWVELMMLIPVGIIIFISLEWLLKGKEIQEIVSAIRSRKGAVETKTS